jgi:hypothetical protein
MSDYFIEEHTVGDYKVKIYHDPDPCHPDEGSDDHFLVAFSNDFHVVRKGTWDCVGDFRDFLHPRYQVDAWDTNEDLPEPLCKPENGPQDPVWRSIYTAQCTDQIEQLVLETGEDTDFSNPEGLLSAQENYDLRSDIWRAWQTYKAAHAEWACFTIQLRNYGGGRMSVSLGEVYDGSETDRWGDPRDPDGFVMVKRNAGWRHTPQEVAEAMIKDWQSYMDGEVYGYRVEDAEGNDVDSCWGFIGDQEECISQGMDSAKWHDEHDRKQMPLPFKPADTGQEEAHG